MFHDDQHGTAIVVLAALLNALKVVEKQMDQLSVLINGAGAAGMAIAKLLLEAGVKDIVLCDSRGAIYRSRTDNMNGVKTWLAENTNLEQRQGTLSQVIEGMDLFVGVSAANVLTADDVQKMGENAIVFALANPDPEIAPEEALPYVKVMATGRSDYPNQINNVLCFPGLFRGMLDVRARTVSVGMKMAAARAIANVISPEEILPDYVIPSVFDRRFATDVAEAVSDTASEEGIARRVSKPGV